MVSLSTNFLNQENWKSALCWIALASFTLVGILCFSLYLTQSASAASIEVNSTADVVLDDGQCTLREAIVAANTDSPSGSTPGECPAGSGPDVVSVPSGWYFLTPGVAMNPSTEMQIVGAGRDLTKIDGQGATQIFSRTSSTALVTIRDLTLQGGASSVGGAFYQAATSTIFENVSFYNNSVVGPGGAAYNNSGELTLTDCIVHYNSTEDPVSGSSSGAGVNNAGGILTVIRTVFAFNGVDPDDPDARGGAIVSGFSGAILIVEDSTFVSNSAAHGGAIYSRGDTTISGSTFSNNNSTGSPGALNSSLLVLDNSTFSKNINGGLATSGVDVWVLNSTFFDNNTGAANITKISGTVTLKNSILFSFSGGTNCSGTITSGGYNLDNNSTCTLGGTGDVSSVDPMLSPLVDNGGPTRTHALNYGSPAIDAGNPAGCTDDVGGPILYDQRGWPRAIDGDLDGVAVCDMGAYEKLIDLFLPLIMR